MDVAGTTTRPLRYRTMNHHRAGTLTVIVRVMLDMAPNGIIIRIKGVTSEPEAGAEAGFVHTKDTIIVITATTASTSVRVYEHIGADRRRSRVTGYGCIIPIILPQHASVSAFITRRHRNVIVSVSDIGHLGEKSVRTEPP